MVYCTEEYGAGGPDEMIEDMMARAKSIPAKLSCSGLFRPCSTPPAALDVITVGCGWGLRFPVGH